MVPDELNVYLWRDGFHLFFPMRGTGSLAHRRHPAAGAARTGTTLTFEDVIPSLRSEAGAGLSFKACSWFSTYRIHHRARRALPRPAAASCSATRRTSTARSARRA